MEGKAEKMNSIKPLTVAILIFAACGFFSLFMSFRAPLSDFGNYYYGARIISQHDGDGAQVYDVLSFNMEVEKMGGKNLFLSHATVTPQSVIFYSCLSWIGSANIAKMIFNAMGLLFFSFIFFRFLRWSNREITWPLVALILAAQVPLYYNLSFGQTYLLITAFILVAVMQAEERPWLSGIVLGIAISLKVSPILFLLWFITQRKYAVVAWTLVTCALPIGWVLLDADLSRSSTDFFTQSLPRMMDGFVSDPFSSSFQSMIVLLRKLMLQDAVLNAEPLFAATPLLIQVINTVIFAALGYALVGAWKEKRNFMSKFLLLILFLFITSGYTSTYSLLLLLPFVDLKNSVGDWVKVVLYGVIMMAPPRMFDGLSPFLEEYKLWLLIVLFIWEVRPQFGFRHIEKMQALTGLLMLGMVILKFAHRPEQLPLTYFKPGVINQDYVLHAFVSADSVKYVSYTSSGFREFAVPFEGKQAGLQEWKYAHGVKWQTIGETETGYLVLSDYHRGPGLMHLYTIRKGHLGVLSAQ